ncbi:MAG: ABC transporter permease [Planctomycetota bacterium]|jgi:ABC-type transport system involved in multi-copper enzyme maturation permease subunit
MSERSAAIETVAPRPGMRSGFVPTFLRALRTGLPPKRALILLVVLALPPLILLLVHQKGEDVGEAMQVLVSFLYLQFLVPLVGLLFGTGILLDEVGGGTLPYLFTRPVPRLSIILGKYAASLLLGTMSLLLSLGALFAVAGSAEVAEGFHGRVVASCLIAFPAYLAAFTFLSVFTRWALLGGFLYAFGVEGGLSLIPGMVRKLTLLYYSRSLFGDWKSDAVPARILFGREPPASTEAAIEVLVIVAVVALVLTWWGVRKKEFVQRTEAT